MKRVVVLHKVFWVGRHTTDAYKVLHNISAKALKKTLDEMNAPYHKWFWEVVGDYNMAKVKDRYSYAEYCLKCARDRSCKDSYSQSVGFSMLRVMDQKTNEET